jgi:penicillin-binding protein 2
VRFTIVIVVFTLFWIMLISRIYEISIQSNEAYEALAQINVERKYYIKPVRGEILDRHHKLLAVNDIGFSIKLAPHLNGKNSDNLEKTIDIIVK